MLTSLIKAKIDNDPTLRARMISALIIGGGVTVAQGQNKGGSFQNVPTCAASSDTGCVVAYASWAKEKPPAPGGAFTSAMAAGTEFACTDPAQLSGNTGNYRGSYVATKTVLSKNFTNDLGGTMPAGVTTPFVLYRDMFKGECKVANGIKYLEISVAMSADDKRTAPPYRSSIVENIGGGMHLMDYNLEIDDLLDLVTKQAAAMPNK
jgi:hypothetical protein